MAYVALVVGLIFAYYILKGAISAAFERVVVLEHEKAVLYVDGKFERVVGAGSYPRYGGGKTYKVIDMRPRLVGLKFKEAVTRDDKLARVSMEVVYRVEDPHAAHASSDNHQKHLLAALQHVMRAAVRETDSRAVLTGRDELAGRIMAAIEPRANEMGTKIVSIYMNEIIFPVLAKDKLYPGISDEQKGAGGEQPQEAR